MKTRKTIITAILLSAVLLGSLLVPVFAAADSLYIIPDSDTRALTYDELWEYRYDTLLYAFTVFSLFILCKLIHNCSYNPGLCRRLNNAAGSGMKLIDRSIALVYQNRPDDHIKDSISDIRQSQRRISPDILGLNIKLSV